LVFPLYSTYASAELLTSLDWTKSLGSCFRGNSQRSKSRARSRAISNSSNGDGSPAGQSSVRHISLAPFLVDTVVLPLTTAGQIRIRPNILETPLKIYYSKNPSKFLPQSSLVGLSILSRLRWRRRVRIASAPPQQPGTASRLTELGEHARSCLHLTNHHLFSRDCRRQ
jgi:hypothetical protein